MRRSQIQPVCEAKVPWPFEIKAFDAKATPPARSADGSYLLRPNGRGGASGLGFARFLRLGFNSFPGLGRRGGFSFHRVDHAANETFFGSHDAISNRLLKTRADGGGRLAVIFDARGNRG